MNNLIKYGLIAAVIGGIYLYNNSGGLNYSEDDIDLNAVLDVTVDTLYSFEETIDADAQPDSDQTFIDFSKELESNYNAAQPALHKTTIGVIPQNDASLLAYEDANQNQTMESEEPALFLIEIDGENARIIASSRSGAVNDHHFSGTGLLAGYLIGSMLSRQRMTGVDTKKLSGKQPISAKNAARARAGSGSHSKGK